MTSIAVVGGGFGGVGAAAMLRRAGYHDVTLFERAPRLGGVWAANTYPGAACDIPSHLYEFSFAPNPGWSRRYAPQAEIQRYVERIAEQSGARIFVGTRVEAAAFADGRWRLRTSAGEFEADVLIAACGQLSIPHVPPLPGLDQFAGPAFHTAEWRHDVDLSGKRVAVVGTGCSAIQVVPAIAPHVAHLDVYQRSPGWTIPKLDFPYSERARRLFARFPLLQRLDRWSIYAFHDVGAVAMTRARWMLKGFELLGRIQIRRAIPDPELRAKVTPRDEVGCKRIMLTDDWYPTLTRPNVSLVVDRIEAVEQDGVRAGGVLRPADVLILATGFRSHAFVAPMEITGLNGTLADAWGDLPRAYLGVTVPDFPNLFLLYGPNTNGGTGSVVATIEASMQHVLAALRARDAAGARTISVRREAADAFAAEVRKALNRTVWHSGCSNWYVDENGNDPSNWPWSWTTYRRRAARLKLADYVLA
jgi:cation diffusion facilitator CzcD-associated flavoprotein CzcO